VQLGFFAHLVKEIANGILLLLIPLGSWSWALGGGTRAAKEASAL
jgi:hypothetical protein